MAKVHETLRKKSDLSIEVYPNIENENIPTGVVTGDKLATNTISTGKLANGCVTTNKLDANAVIESKIADGSISTGKIINNAVTNDKLASNSVGTSNIINGSITQDKIQAGAVGTTELADSSVSVDKINDILWKWLKRIENTYILYAGSGDEKIYGVLDTFTADDDFNEYLPEDIISAFDFDRASSTDYTRTDLEIYKSLIDGLYKDFYGNTNTKVIQGTDRIISLFKSGTDYTIQMYEDSTSTKLFKLTFNGDTYTITDYYYSSYIYLELVKLFNQNADYER